MVYDLTGQKFGRLIVIKRVENAKDKQAQWLCQCECGNTVVVKSIYLRTGDTRSCGCFKRERTAETHTKHGLVHTRIYKIWCDIKYRCFNAHHSHYKDYGGRGIIMCDEWNKNFQKFYDWAMSNGYDENAKKYECTIDRIDNNKGYSPDNCRWVTMKEQTKNKRNSIILTYKGETHCLVDWAEIVGIGYGTLLSRINKYGWSGEKTLSTPLRGKNK